VLVFRIGPLTDSDDRLLLRWAEAISAITEEKCAGFLVDLSALRHSFSSIYTSLHPLELRCKGFTAPLDFRSGLPRKMEGGNDTRHKRIESQEGNDSMSANASGL